MFRSGGSSQLTGQSRSLFLWSLMKQFFRRNSVFVCYVSSLSLLVFAMLGSLYADYSKLHSFDAMMDSQPMDPLNERDQSQSVDHQTQSTTHHTHAHSHDSSSSMPFDQSPHHLHVASDVLDQTSHANDNEKQISDLPWGQSYFPDYTKIRVWCLVPTLWPKKKEVMYSILRTWGRHCSQLIFVIDSDFGGNAPDMLNVTLLETHPILLSSKLSDIYDQNGNIQHFKPEYRTYYAVILKLKFEHKQTTKDRNIWEKVWKMWYHIGKYHLSDSDWFLKIDDDTFFSAINFRGFVQYYNADNSYYFGHTLLHEWARKNVVFNSGTCYAISRGSLSKVYKIFETQAFLNDIQRQSKGKKYCVHRKGDQEDPTFAICLRSVGINPYNTLTNECHERFFTFKPTDHFQIKKEQSWFWRHKTQCSVTGPDCCNVNNPISFHNFKFKPEKELNELDKRYNTPEGSLLYDPYGNIVVNNGSNSGRMMMNNNITKKFEIPNQPLLFLYNNESVKFEFDEYRNILNPPRGQRIYLGPNQSRVCFKCEGFTFQ